MLSSSYIFVNERGRREVVVLGVGTETVATDEEVPAQFDEAIENDLSPPVMFTV